MYTPAYSRADDPARLAAVIRDHSFATLVTHGDGGLVATHLPFLFEPQPDGPGVLLSHMARANPQWRHFAAAAEVLVIFQGAHGYISPGWYVTDGAHVPTWNYVAVHAYGAPQVLDEARAGELLLRTVQAYEPADSPYRVPEERDFLRRNVAAIVAFEIRISRLEGKFKLSQNRTPEDARAVIAALDRQADADSVRLAAAMRGAMPVE